MRRLRAFWRGLPPAAGGFIIATVLFLLGAASAAFYGLYPMMRFGLIGAAASIGFVAFGCDWSRRGR